MRSRLQNALIKGTPEYISFEEGEEFQRFSIHTMAEEEGHQLREGFWRSGIDMVKGFKEEEGVVATTLLGPNL